MNLSGFFFFWIVSSSLLSATPATATPASARPIVAVSVEPLALIVREICADSCEVLTLVPKGVSEHSWQPGPKDVVKVKTAVAAIGVGLSFDERWFEKIGYPTASVLWIGKSLDPMPWWSDDMSASSHKATTHDHAHNSIDPHVWVDARRMSSAATMMGAHLAKLIPMAEAAFKSRSQVFSERVLKLQLEVENRRKLWRTRPVVMFHDLAGYFARRFNLPVLSVSAGHAGHDLSAKMIADIARRFKDASVAAILVEREDGASRSLARELKSKVKVVDFNASKTYGKWDDWYLHVVTSWEDVLKS